MKTIRAQLKSISPYSQSGAIGAEKLANESHDDYERRTWRERVHADSDGLAFIPPMAFKKAIDAAAKYHSGNLKIAGAGHATYTKHFESGTMIIDPIPLGIRKDDVPGEWLFLDANGKKGKQSSGRVMRCMPKFDHWKGELVIRVLDEKVLNSKPGSAKTGPDGTKIPMTVLEWVLRETGAIIGIGRFRPEVQGFYGRFVVASFEIEEDANEAVA